MEGTRCMMDGRGNVTENKVEGYKLTFKLGKFRRVPLMQTFTFMPDNWNFASFPILCGLQLL